MIPDRKNEYYKNDEELLEAIADAMREEYRAIVDAGLLVQLDDARAAVTYDRMVPPASFADYRHWLERQVEAINRATEGIPTERIRYHVCWGSWPGRIPAMCHSRTSSIWCCGFVRVRTSSRGEPAPRA